MTEDALPGTVLAGLPLFPLHLVLFPGARLPLRVFEVRYLDMIGRCLREGTGFGVVCLTEGAEVQQPPSSGATGFAPESFEDVGTLAVIREHSRPQPGLIELACSGTRRFRLTRRERLPHGLWTGDADLLPDDPEVPVPDDLRPTAAALHGLLRRIELRVGDRADTPVQRPYRIDDCGWVANRWCELLPLPLAVRQRLLETDSPLLRLELVSDLLERLRAAGGPPEGDAAAT